MSQYGKDSPGRFIEGALTGGSGPSEGIVTKSIGRGQKIKSAYSLDNVGEIAGPHLDDEHGGKMGGGMTNLGHSLEGASTVAPDKLGATGATKVSRASD